jgi:hypothetical protein
MSFYLVTFADILVQALNLASYVFLRIFAFAFLLRWRSVRAIRQPCPETTPMPDSWQNEFEQG